METILSNGVTFEVPTLTNGESFKIEKVNFRNERYKIPTLQFTDTWDVCMFETPFLPVKIGSAPNVTVPIRVLDLPIIFPEDSYLRIPKELQPLTKVIQDLVTFESENNSNFHKYHAYLTTDFSIQKLGSTQRKEGFHVDGYQGARTSKRELINRSYVYSSTNPTEFAGSGVSLRGIDDSKYNIFHHMDRQLIGKPVWQPKPFDIVFFNVYNIHRSPVAVEETERFFFRLTFDVRKFDRLGNTHNPMFNYNWEMVARDTQKDLL